jgi:hypothetical protein
MFRLLFPSVILKGHSLRQRWVRLLQPMARLPHGMAARCGHNYDVIACKTLRRYDNKYSIIKFNVYKHQQETIVSRRFHRRPQ